MSDLFRRYAQVAVELAVPVQPGQHLLIVAPPEISPLVHAITEAAFARGADDVSVFYEDAVFEVFRTASAAPAQLGVLAPWRAAALTDHAQAGQPLLTLHAPTPGLAAPADRSGAALAARNQALGRYGALRSRVAFNWSVMAVATCDWAAFLRPELSQAAALTWLWARLEHLLRLDTPDPLAAWRRHAADLSSRCERLDRLELASLHLSGPGTDLELGLPSGHRWFGPLVPSVQGVTGIPNLPTEEISTLPHRLQATGTVRATRPLSVPGGRIDGLELTFREGRVTAFRCAAGAELLERLLATDDGASRLGEVALVPETSLVAQEGRTFYSTLIDENASCHLALGRAYPVVLQGGREMTPAVFAAHGGNDSRVHLDFMVGSPALNVRATTRRGDSLWLMRQGQWV